MSRKPLPVQGGSGALSPKMWAVIGAKTSLVGGVAEEEALGRGWGSIPGFQLCSTLPVVLASSCCLLGLALLICAMGTTSLQTCQSFRQHRLTIPPSPPTPVWRQVLEQTENNYPVSQSSH